MGHNNLIIFKGLNNRFIVKTTYDFVVNRDHSSNLLVFEKIGFL